MTDEEKLKAFYKEATEEFTHSTFDSDVEADKFFMKYGVGNNVFEMDMPFERFLSYEHLLMYLRMTDCDKYQRMHKGIPFYFLAFLSVDIRYYEKALFFIDSSMSEDIKNRGDKFIEMPSCKFLLLEDKGQVAQRSIIIINECLEYQINRFNTLENEHLTINDFVYGFVKRLLSKNETRTIVSALYVFLLEYSEHRNEILMRSVGGGSIAPFIKHLFSGAVIFETLLKVLFPLKDDERPVKTLRDIFQSSSYKNIYPEITDTSADSFQQILDSIKDSTLQTAFTVTTKIRNTTGHNLVWDDAFSDLTNYEELFNQEVNAIFYIIIISFLSSDK